jgi:hypothetical protein
MQRPTGRKTAARKDPPLPVEKEGEMLLIVTASPSTCSECGAGLEAGDFLRVESGNPLCVECADLGHLEFLPSGDTALTRRSRKHSTLFAIVVEFNRRRRRYERRGTLVEREALEKAELECLSDEDKRAKNREVAAVRREALDGRYQQQFAGEIRSSFPSCPAEEAETIARHACEKHSGRVGRSARAKEFDPKTVILAVRAHIRHVHTTYDHLLATGVPRPVAREKIADAVERKVREWKSPA